MRSVTSILGRNLLIERGFDMTLEQHYAAARELWLICEAVRRLWLLTGDVEGPMRPQGRALAIVRRYITRLHKAFLHDFPGQFDPYKDIEC